MFFARKRVVFNCVCEQYTTPETRIHTSLSVCIRAWRALERMIPVSFDWSSLAPRSGLQSFSILICTALSSITYRLNSIVTNRLTIVNCMSKKTHTHVRLSVTTNDKHNYYTKPEIIIQWWQRTDTGGTNPTRAMQWRERENVDNVDERTDENWKNCFKIVDAVAVKYIFGLY